MEGFPGGPVMVRVTYIDDLPAWIEMWHQTEDDPPRYPYIDIMRPSAPTDEEWLEMLGRARYYTFVRSEAGERADQSSTSGISNPTDLAEPMESNERGE